MKDLRCKASQGFTLIEVLVALFLLSLLSLLAWRALDGMARAGELTTLREQSLQRVDVGLAQWSADLDAVADTGVVLPLDFDGQYLRLTRHSPTAGSTGSGGIVVVAWALRRTEQGFVWQRFALPAVTTKNGLQAAWDMAQRWARTPLAEDATHVSTLFAVSNWRVFYFRDNAWTNPLSSAGATTDGAAKIPDGVQLILDLPEGGNSVNNDATRAMSGRLTKYWVAPTLGATR